MLTALHLGNFKAFEAPARLPIRPITLIFGPNSAGKSSLIHGLALGHEVMRRGRFDITRTKLGGDAIDLGGFRQYIHRRTLDQRVTWGVEVDTRELFHKGSSAVFSEHDSLFASVAFGLPLDDNGHPLPYAKPALISFQISIDGESVVRISRRPDERLRVDELTPAFLHLMKSYNTLRPAGSGDGRRWSDVDLQKAISALAIAPDGLVPVSLQYERAEDNSVEPVAEFLRRVLFETRKVIFTELKRLTYLGPFRSYPPRHLAFTEQDDANRAAGGGRAWERMRKSKKLRGEVNAWLNAQERLQTRYKLSLRRFVAPLTAQNALSAGFDEIHARLEEPEADEDAQDEAPPLGRWDRDAFVKVVTRKLLQDRDVEADTDLVLVDMLTNTTVSHRDVGIGISQVLPVLVEAYGNKGRLVAIEQPEIHLHPRLQAELTDVFLDAALGERKNTFLLETHSEHLILRVLRRIRETAQARLPEGLPSVRPEDVAVLSVVPDRAGARIVEIPITKDGEFERPWPGGFFPDRMKELY